MTPNVVSINNKIIMASRRILKKQVKDIFTVLMMECLVKTLHVVEADRDRLDELVAEVLDLKDDFVSRISHTEPGNVKAYYKKFRTDFETKVNGVAEALDKLG